MSIAVGVEQIASGKLPGIKGDPRNVSGAGDLIDVVLNGLLLAAETDSLVQLKPGNVKLRYVFTRFLCLAI